MHTVLCSQPNIHNAKTRADEPDNFLAALAPASASGFFPSSPAPNFFPQATPAPGIFFKAALAQAPRGKRQVAK